MSTYSGGTVRPHAPSAYSTPASTTLFRRLTWEGTVPLEIRVDSKELPANSDRGLECYFMQAPRVSYLPLLMPEIKKFLMDVVFDEAAATVLKEDEWWFESEEGTLLKWHWPIGLIYDNHTISSTIRALPHPPASQAVPLQLILHLASPTEKLLLSPSAEACKQAFMGQLKEADFMRWGNTKLMTGLRKVEQDGMWKGVKEHNFDDYWRVASKVTPTTTPNRPTSPPPATPSSTSMHSKPSPSTEAHQEKDGAYKVRSVPVRVYLPDGPVLQELVPPILDNGAPHTLSQYLSTSLPLLFPPAPLPAHSQSFSHSLSRTQQALPAPPSLAYALIQGVLAPPDAEMAWLGACMAGADGWVNVCWNREGRAREVIVEKRHEGVDGRNKRTDAIYTVGPSTR